MSADVERLAELTKEEIERRRDSICAAIALVEGISPESYDAHWRAAHELCDLAIRGAERREPREDWNEAIEAAAKVCEERAGKEMVAWPRDPALLECAKAI